MQFLKKKNIIKLCFYMLSGYLKNKIGKLTSKASNNRRSVPASLPLSKQLMRNNHIAAVGSTQNYIEFSDEEDDDDAIVNDNNEHDDDIIFVNPHQRKSEQLFYQIKREHQQPPQLNTIRNNSIMSYSKPNFNQHHYNNKSPLLQKGRSYRKPPDLYPIQRSNFDMLNGGHSLNSNFSNSLQNQSNNIGNSLTASIRNGNIFNGNGIASPPIYHNVNNILGGSNSLSLKKHITKPKEVSVLNVYNKNVVCIN